VSELQRAFVVSTGKNSAWISIDGEASPRFAALRRMSGKRFMPVPGDVVQARVLEDGRAVVERIEPREFTLRRHTVDGRAKTMAANIDLLVTVTSLANPAPRTITLDQLLAFAELERIAAAVVLTKPDLVAPEQCDELASIYGRLSYSTVLVNPKHGVIAPLRELIAGRRAMLVGNSGVGKSTIFRALGGDTSVGEVSRYGLGRQTTSAGRLYRFGGGFLIDSPGINEFGVGAVEARTLGPAFREIPELAKECRFADCTHLAEPDCAVAAAAQDGSMAASRYASYRRMLLEPT
jgi:ribosome biogenesis GTPase / thiamine phosphate phosphatase